MFFFISISILGRSGVNGPIASRVTNMTEKCRPEPGLEPRVFRLTYDRSTS